MTPRCAPAIPLLALCVSLSGCVVDYEDPDPIIESDQLEIVGGTPTTGYPAVVLLNRAVAVSFAEGPERGFDVLRPVAESGELDVYLYYHGTRADLYRRLGKPTEARASYERALALAANAPERRFLQRRLSAL